jgi:tetratricopeptide (TPR) repeat protein
MCWRNQLRKGKKLLSKQELQKALKCFETDVTKCPVRSQDGLEESLYYLGLTLKKLGKDDSALRCWLLGKKVNKNGISNKMIKIESLFENHKKLFIQIQVQKYLKAKKTHCFCSDAEKDVVNEIIINYWQDLESPSEIEQLSNNDKLKFFKEQLVIFPHSTTSMIFTDSQSGSGVETPERCTCGSGYPSTQCCGSTNLSEESGIGDF